VRNQGKHGPGDDDARFDLFSTPVASFILHSHHILVAATDAQNAFVRENTLLSESVALLTFTRIIPFLHIHQIERLANFNIHLLD